MRAEEVHWGPAQIDRKPGGEWRPSSLQTPDSRAQLKIVLTLSRGGYWSNGFRCPLLTWPCVGRDTGLHFAVTCHARLLSQASSSSLVPSQFYARASASRRKTDVSILRVSRLHASSFMLNARTKQATAPPFLHARTHGSDDVRARVITWTGIRDKARAAAWPKIYFTPAYAFTFLRSNLPASHFPL